MLNRPHMYLGVLEDANVLLPRENGRGWLKCRAGAVIQHSCVLWRLTIRNILTSTYDFQRSRQCSRMPVCTHVHVDHTSIQNPVHLFMGCHQSSVPPLYRMVCHIFCSFFPFPFPRQRLPQFTRRLRGRLAISFSTVGVCCAWQYYSTSLRLQVKENQIFQFTQPSFSLFHLSPPHASLSLDSSVRVDPGSMGCACTAFAAGSYDADPNALLLFPLLHSQALTNQIWHERS